MKNCKMCKKIIMDQVHLENGGYCYACIDELGSHPYLEQIEEDNEKGWLDHSEFDKKLCDVTGSKGCSDIEPCESCQ